MTSHPQPKAALPIQPGHYQVASIVDGRALWPDDKDRCTCAELVALHVLKKDGTRGACSRSGCGCPRFTPMEASDG